MRRPPSLPAPQDATTQQVTQLVRDFLANVPKNDPKVFQEFFADDVIYTRATGLTVSKADILRNIDVRATNDPQITLKPTISRCIRTEKWPWSTFG